MCGFLDHMLKCNVAFSKFFLARLYQFLVCLFWRTFNPSRTDVSFYFHVFQHSAEMFLSHKNQSIDLRSNVLGCKSIDWFLYDRNIWDSILKNIRINGSIGTRWVDNWWSSVNLLIYNFEMLLSAAPQNGQTHSNNTWATSDELFEYVWPFCDVDI